MLPREEPPAELINFAEDHKQASKVGFKQSNSSGISSTKKKLEIPSFGCKKCIHVAQDDRPFPCAGLFHGVNVKLTKAGGITPGKRMILRAKELGLKAMVGRRRSPAVA